MKIKLLIVIFFAIIFCNTSSTAQINPLGLYYCKMYRYSGSTLVFYCYGKVAITQHPTNPNELHSSDTSCTGYCAPCWDITFNQADSTFDEAWGCISCAEGKLYPNDSIYFKQKQGTAPAVNYYFGNLLYNYPNSITEIENLNDKVFVYPNPAKDFLYVQSWVNNEINEINLLDCKGKEVAVYKSINKKQTKLTFGV